MWSLVCAPRRWMLASLWVGVFTCGSASMAQESFPIVDAQAARRFATLPVEVGTPEGLAVAPTRREVFVGTLNIGADNFLLRLDLLGRVQARINVGTAPLLGLAFNPLDGHVYVASAGALAGQASSIRRIPASFAERTTIEDVALVPVIGPPPGRVENNPDGSEDMITFGQNATVPNGLVFRQSDGALFFTDSFQGAVFQIADPTRAENRCPASAECVELVVQDGLLAAIGDPQFGANGVALSEDEQSLFVANTGDDRIFRFEFETGALTLLAGGINGADGLIAGPNGTLIVTANQADQIVVLEADSGRVLAELGEFLGTLEDGTPRALSVPASVVQIGNQLLITNLGRPAGPDAAPVPGTLSRISLPRALRD